MSNIMRISGDYRTGGIDRAVIGHDGDTGEWVVEYGTVRVPFNPSHGFDVHTVTRHATDAIAGMASDLWCEVNLYKYESILSGT